jgi:hypothetical protein
MAKIPSAKKPVPDNQQPAAALLLQHLRLRELQQESHRANPVQFGL